MAAGHAGDGVGARRAARVRARRRSVEARDALGAGQQLGFGLLVFIEVMLDKTTPDVFDQFAAAVKQAPSVLECHMVAGGFDYLVKTRFEDMAAYRNFLGQVLWTLPGVKETRTYAVMEEIKNDGPLPLV